MGMTPGPPTETPIQNLCAEVAEVACDRTRRCGFADPTLSDEACLLYERDVVCAPAAAALARAQVSGEGRWLPDLGRRCVEAVRDLDCDAPKPDLLTLPQCQQAFVPSARAGDVCTFAGSCVDGTFCDASTGCPGTCRALASVGASCAETRCEAGLYCSLAPSNPRQCVAQSDLGAACETAALNSSCLAGSFCEGNPPATPVCLAARGRGAGCTDAAQCAGGLTCILNVCSQGSLGDTCGDDFDCRGNFRCVSGQCRAPRADGESCALDGECAVGLVCENETCLLGRPDGSSCLDAPCASRRCVDGTCVPRLLDGSACTLAGDCVEGRICLDGRCRAFSDAFCPI